MLKQIEVESAVYARVQKDAVPFEDTFSTTLVRILDERDRLKSRPSPKLGHKKLPRGLKTPNSVFRQYILTVLKELGGKASSSTCLQRIYERFGSTFNKYDLERTNPHIEATVRWKKTVNWEVCEMRKEGVLLPVDVGGEDNWELTNKVATLQ